ncbi:ABC transporter ATP-binding protein [bacterium]|nr:ABC transporter ATP-binding protein [bacterium]
MTIELKRLKLNAAAEIELTVAAGERVAIVGPTGTGKTKLLRMIAGLEPVAAGDVLLDGQSVLGIPPRDRGIALVPSNLVLYPHLTVYGNIAFGLKLAKVARPEIDRRVREAARILDLSALLDRTPHGLTPAKRPLVAIGRAIARRPQVLLLDEPLGSLANVTRKELESELATILDRLATSTIIATRHREEADHLCSRVMPLDANR